MRCYTSPRVGPETNQPVTAQQQTWVYGDGSDEASLPTPLLVFSFLFVVPGLLLMVYRRLASRKELTFEHPPTSICTGIEGSCSAGRKFLALVKAL